jgi:hypothetical protein
LVGLHSLCDLIGLGGLAVSAFHRQSKSQSDDKIRRAPPLVNAGIKALDQADIPPDSLPA